MNNALGEQPTEPYNDFAARVRSMRFDRFYAGAIVAAAITNPLAGPQELADKALSIACSMLSVRGGNPL